ncbi:Pyridoxine 4-dehydrogenase [Xylographa trunciseda]|nr:Pyridoxine 4-dehydrogenase [Xylographa trunciseda]
MPTLIGKEVGATGFGLMGLTWRANPCPETQAWEAMRTALSHGANFWNGGEFYGPPERNSMQLLRRYFTQYPEDADKVVLSIKGDVDPETHQVDGTEEGVRKSVENCIKLLDGKKHLDIFECARVDPKVSIETTIEALAKLVTEGKITGISLSEVKESTIRRAAKVHHICAVEVELSMWETKVLTNGVAAACAELSIPLVAYSPLGRGFLTGDIKTLDDIPKDDMRRRFPRFSEENFPKNLDLVYKVEALAKKMGCKPSQLALAWVRQLSERPGMPTIIPIPGATTEARVTENLGMVRLSDSDMKEIDTVLESVIIEGHRYPSMLQDLLEG